MAVMDMTEQEITEYFTEFNKGHQYTEVLRLPTGATSATGVFTKFAGSNAIDVIASAVTSDAVWDGARFRDTDLGQSIWAIRGNQVLRDLATADAGFVDKHAQAYRALISKDRTDPNIEANTEVLRQKIAENKTERDKTAEENKTKKDARAAEIAAVNRTEVLDFVRAGITTPELQAFRDMVDANVTGASPTKYTTYLAMFADDSQLLDALHIYIAAATSPVTFSPEFLSKIMGSGTYKYPEIMNGATGTGNKYANTAGTPTADYTAMQTGFGNVRTATLRPLTAPATTPAMIAGSADAYDSLIGTMPDTDPNKTAYKTRVDTARTQTQTAAQNAADRNTAIAAANTHSVIDFLRENIRDNQNQGDMSLSAYRSMVDSGHIGTTVRGTPVTAANINQLLPNRYVDFLGRVSDDSGLILNLDRYTHRRGITNLGSPELLAAILSSDTYKYDELLVPVIAGAAPATRTSLLNNLHNAFGGTFRDSALGALTANEKDTLFINYNMKELTAIMNAKQNDPKNVGYADILNRQNAAFDGIFPQDKYPNGIADPHVKQMLLNTRFRRYKGGPNTNMNAIRHNLNGLIGAAGADAIIECTDAYGNAVNGAYGRKTLPSLKGDTALIAQNKILEVMCKKNGMNKRETDMVMNRTANYDAQGMRGIQRFVTLGLKNFIPALGPSLLISAVSTVSPLAGGVLGFGFAAHSMWNMSMGEFNAAKERLTRGGAEPANKDVWAEARKSGMMGRMVKQAIPTLAAYLLPSAPFGIGAFFRANPHALPLAFAAKSGWQQGTKSYNEGETMLQSVLDGAAAGLGGYAGAGLGRTIGTTMGGSFNEGYAEARVQKSEGLLGVVRGGLSGLREVGSDIAKAPGYVAGALGIGAAAKAAAAGGTENTGNTAGGTGNTGNTTGDTATEAGKGASTTTTNQGRTDGRVDANNNGYDDNYEAWANSKSDLLKMFKGGHYVDKVTGEVVNPHSMSVKPGSFSWVNDGQNAPALTTERPPAPGVRTVTVTDGSLNAAQEAALLSRVNRAESGLAEARAALNAATQRLGTLESGRFTLLKPESLWGTGRSPVTPPAQAQPTAEIPVEPGAFLNGGADGAHSRYVLGNRDLDLLK